ncbi:tetratricopeptide repeat protein [Pedobacter sp. KACC 23697]|uniref:histidine kinase n=1 Tax=Pedobacter sp. KACC 23697 TaxID=3149230 RepID=A0AAU7K3C7_9SPHI
MKYYHFSLILLLLFSCSQNRPRKEEGTINIYYDQAFDFRQTNSPDSAFKYFSKAKDLFSQQKDSLGIAKCLVNMALISIDRGDYFGGQEFSLEALRYFNVNEKKQFVYFESNLHELALASFYLKNYDQAIKYYNLSLKYAPDSISTLTTRNNIANAYINKKEYAKALEIYQHVLQQKIISPEIYAMTLTNLASAKWERNEKYNAVPELLKALQIRKRENDIWGQNSSYSHLADYYFKSHPDSALFYATQMYHIAQKIKSPDNQIEALQKLIKLSPNEETKYFYSVYEKLNDSVQTARSAAKNQFALVRYDVEKSKADNLVLQKDVSAKRYQLIIIISIALLLFSYGILWYRKRKQKIELKAKNAIRENQLQTSKKVHDKVANKIYRVMSEVENKDDLNKDHLLDQLEYIYNTSRDISYEITENRQLKTFSQQLSDLFSAYISNTCLIEVMHNEEELWANVQEKIKGEIFIVLLELMNNMKKHSGATRVKIEFKRHQNIISINYQDNGIGLPKKMTFNNGLRNTETRIENISGTITFETMNKTGLGISISFPIH